VIHLYAGLEHYAEHMWPIWEALPDEVRGATWSPRHDLWWGNPPPASMAAGPLMVAGFSDAVGGLTRGRDLVYVEHGAGQSYGGDPLGAGAAGLSGTTERGLAGVRLFLCPNETVAARWRAVHPAPAVVVGCPKLDRWLTVPRETRRPCVAVTFHWDCTLIPETRSAWREYDHVLPELAAWCRANDVQLLGHGHPRLWSAIERRWRDLEVERVEHLADVLDRATVLVADNTSAMFEAAAIGISVVAVNARSYRRDVEHGLRFWSHVPGRQVDEPAELVHAVARAVADPDDARALREAAADAAYAHRDGHAAERAATAILEHMT
jgi:hypothetical protein